MNANVYYHYARSKQIAAILRNGFTNYHHWNGHGVRLTRCPHQVGQNYHDMQTLEITLPAQIDLTLWYRLPPADLSSWKEWIVPAHILNANAEWRLLSKEQWQQAWEQDWIQPYKLVPQYEEINVNKGDWWKYPDSFLKVIMNTGETREVTGEGINAEILESLILGWERQMRCPDDPLVNYIEVPRFARHVIHTAWSDVPGFGIEPGHGMEPLHCYGYFASQYEILHDWTWEVAEHNFFKLTDKSDLQWRMPEKPESKPFLAVFRLTGDQLTPADAAIPGWLADVESAIGFLLMKTFSEWGSDLGFRPFVL